MFFAIILSGLSLVGKRKNAEEVELEEFNKKVDSSFPQLQLANVLENLINTFMCIYIYTCASYCDQVYQTGWESAKYGQEFEGCWYLAPRGCFQD